MKKFFGIATAVAFAVAVAVPSASALSSADVELLIAIGVIPADKAEAARAAVTTTTTTTTTTGSSAYCGPFTRSLTMGSTGVDVTTLQDALIASGDLVIPAGVSKGYFGALTKSALASWQAKNAVAPAAGYFGPVTMAKFATMCSTTPGTGTTTTTTTTTTLNGGAGSITVDSLSDFTNEEVGEGEDDVEVMSFEVEADDDSDVMINSIKVEFVQNTSADSEDLADYADSVSVWFDGEMVGEADAEDFTENSDVYTKSISLDGLVIEAGETGEIVIAVSALNNLDSGDIDTDAWVVDVLNVRFEDGDGVVTTEDTDADSLEQNFDFSDFATSADVELKISLEDDTINDAHVIDIHDSDDTDNVELLSFNIEAEGDSDILIKDLSVNFDSNGFDLEDGVSTVYLYADGKKIGSESITKNTATPGTDETIEFDEIDFTVDAGEEVEFIVKAKVKSIADGIADGDTLSAQVSSTERALIDAEDEAGEDISTSDMTGSASGDAHGLFDEGIMVSDVTFSESKAGTDTTNDTGTYVIEFYVTAFGEAMYIFDDASTTAATSNTVFAVSNNSTVTAVSGTLQRADGNSEVGGTAGFMIEENEKAKFRLTVAATATTTSGFHNVQLDSVAWTASSTASTGTAYSFELGADAKTGDLNLIVR